MRDQECSLSFPAPRRAQATAPKIGPRLVNCGPTPAPCRSPRTTFRKAENTWSRRPGRAGMSGRSGYGNGYGYSDAGRYDHGDGSHGNSSLGVNEYSGLSAGNSGGGRRPGGYGGFYPESSQQPSLPPNPSPERRRDRSDGDRQQHSSQSTSRSRTRNGKSDIRHQGSRDDRSRDALRPPDSRGRDRNGSDAGALEGNTREMQSVEGSSMIR